LIAPRYGDISSDHAFDSLLPATTRALSAMHWSPFEVARRASRLFSDAGARRVLDVGSGVGKFVLCAARSAPNIAFYGVEQRPHLVRHARRAGALMGVENARFLDGDATLIAWDAFDGLYFFNPFGENLLSPPDWIDPTVELSRPRYEAEVLRVEGALRRVRVGMIAITYNGCGAHIPSSFELAHRETVEHASLRVWVKRRAEDDGGYFTELYDRVTLSTVARPTR